MTKTNETIVIKIADLSVYDVDVKCMKINPSRCCDLKHNTETAVISHNSLYTKSQQLQAFSFRQKHSSTSDSHHAMRIMWADF